MLTQNARRRGPESTDSARASQSNKDVNKDGLYIDPSSAYVVPTRDEGRERGRERQSPKVLRSNDDFSQVRLFRCDAVIGRRAEHGDVPSKLR